MGSLCFLQAGDPSHELYVKERESLLASLKKRANRLFQVLNELEGVTCNEPQGALYCMPRIRLSPKVAEVHLPAGVCEALLCVLVDRHLRCGKKSAEVARLSKREGRELSSQTRGLHAFGDAASFHCAVTMGSVQSNGCYKE